MIGRQNTRQQEQAMIGSQYRVYAAFVVEATWPFPPISRCRGHALAFKNGGWVYADGWPYKIDRPCGHCGKDRTPEGHDGCLGTLQNGVMNACCGHGEAPEAYVQYWSKPRIAGEDALRVFREAGINIPALHTAHKEFQRCPQLIVIDSLCGRNAESKR